MGWSESRTSGVVYQARLLAVLAFTNMSGDPERGFLSDGVADDIITELSASAHFSLSLQLQLRLQGPCHMSGKSRELGVQDMFWKAVFGAVPNVCA